MPGNTDTYRRLALYLTMDTGTLALFRRNRVTNAPPASGATPTAEIMQKRAHTHLGRIAGLDLIGVDRINSDRILVIVNRPC